MTQWDIVKMGPHLGMTDDNFSLKHSELYPQDWYNDIFVGTDWQAVQDHHTGK